MGAIRSYFRELSNGLGAGWNRFWFTPSDPLTVCVLRVFVGLAAFYFILSHTADLAVWFGQDGLLPVETVRQLTGMDRGGPEGSLKVYRWSYLHYLETPGLMWTAHVVAALFTLALTVGLFTRITVVLSLVVVLSYVHRAPMITGQFEPVLTMTLFYLCFAPCGAVLSLDRVLSLRRGIAEPVDRTANESTATSLAANISLRMMQVHLAALYLMMGATKLAGEPWWSGEAVWWLIAHTESRLVDLTLLDDQILVINLWTHAIVLFELTFGILIWNRLARPLLLGWAAVMWISLALITGLVSYCAMMLVANLCFVPAPWWKEMARRCRR